MKYLVFGVRVMPFIVGFFYILGLTLIFFDLSYEFYNVIDMMIYCSPLMILMMYMLSFLANFCKYHKLCILLPLIGQISVIINSYVIDMNNTHIYVFTAFYILTILTYILCCFKVFGMKKKNNN